MKQQLCPTHVKHDLYHPTPEFSPKPHFYQKQQGALTWSVPPMILGHPLEKITVVLIIPVVLVQAVAELPSPLGIVEMIVEIPAGSGVAVLQPGSGFRQEGLRGGAVFPRHLGQTPGQVGGGGQSVAFSPQDLVRRPLHRSPQEALVPGDDSVAPGAVGGGRGVGRADVGSSGNGRAVADEGRHQICRRARRRERSELCPRTVIYTPNTEEFPCTTHANTSVNAMVTKGPGAAETSAPHASSKPVPGQSSSASKTAAAINKPTPNSSKKTTQAKKKKQPQATHTVLWLHQSGFVSLCEKGQENPNILATASLGTPSSQTRNDKMLMATGIHDRNRIHAAPTNPSLKGQPEKRCHSIHVIKLPRRYFTFSFRTSLPPFAKRNIPPLPIFTFNTV